MGPLDDLLERAFKDEPAKKQLAVTALDKLMKGAEFSSKEDRAIIKMIIDRIIGEYRLKAKINQSPSEVISYFRSVCMRPLKHIREFIGEDALTSSFCEGGDSAMIVARLSAYLLLAAALDARTQSEPRMFRGQRALATDGRSY